MVERCEGVVDGWHQATVREANAHKETIVAQMDQWFIAQLVDGKVTGAGYGGQVEACVPEELGHLVILRNKEETVSCIDVQQVQENEETIMTSKSSHDKINLYAFRQGRCS